MTQKNRKMQELLEKSDDFLTTDQVTKAGLHRSLLSQFVEKGKLYKVGRGIYVKSDAWEDEMYLLQYRYSKGIFSHETALYLHSLTDRTPMIFSMTFPRGYNAPSIKNENVLVYRNSPKYYRLGITETLSPSGKILRAYNRERTLCDILRGHSASDIQVVNHAIKQYVNSKDRDIPKLMAYAKQLHVESKMAKYLEVLL